MLQNGPLSLCLHVCMNIRAITQLTVQISLLNITADFVWVNGMGIIRKIITKLCILEMEAWKLRVAALSKGFNFDTNCVFLLMAGYRYVLGYLQVRW